MGPQPPNWKFLLTFTVIAAAGLFSGLALNRKINSDKLKRGFGFFVLGIGLFMLIKLALGNPEVV